MAAGMTLYHALKDSRPNRYGVRYAERTCGTLAFLAIAYTPDLRGSVHFRLCNLETMESAEVGIFDVNTGDSDWHPVDNDKPLQS